MSHIDHPGSLDEAVELVSRSGAVPIAGGVAILLGRRLGKPGGDRFVALGALSELRAVRDDRAHSDLVVGAATTLAELARSAVVRDRAPLLAAAAGSAASAGIRSVATVAGNLIDAPGASDVVAAAVALEASLDVRSTAGDRRVAVREVASGSSGLRRDEIVLALRVPVRRPSGGSLQRLQTQGRADRPAVAVAVQLVVANGTVLRARGGATSAADRLIDVVELSRLLEGVALTTVTGRFLDPDITAAALAAVDRTVGEGATLVDDARASAAYRREMVGVMAVRAVVDAAREAGR